MRDVVVVDSVRTGLAKSFRGTFNLTRPDDMVAHCIDSLLDRNSKIDPAEIDDVIVGAASQIGETKTKDGIKRVFRLFDQDDNGVIDFEEFKGIAKYLKDGINDDEILEMMHSTHVNQKTSTNEGFTFEEFYNIVAKFNNK